MDAELASEINENLDLAFNHLREAIMLALAGKPPMDSMFPTGLDDFLKSEGDPNMLLSQMDGLFPPEEFSVKVPDNPEHDNQDAPVEEGSDQAGPSVETADALSEILDEEALMGDDDSDEFDGLFDDIDEADEPQEDGDAPAAF